MIDPAEVRVEGDGGWLHQIRSGLQTGLCVSVRDFTCLATQGGKLKSARLAADVRLPAREGCTWVGRRGTGVEP